RGRSLKRSGSLDALATGFGAQSAPDAIAGHARRGRFQVAVAGFDRIGDEPHRSVGEHGVHAPGVAARWRDHQVVLVTRGAAVEARRTVGSQDRVEGNAVGLSIIPLASGTAIDLS